MPRRLQPLVRPLVVVALTVLAIYGGNKLLFPGGGGYVVTAEFRDAAGLTKNSNVKIGGVAGGSVTDLRLTDRDTALVTMELDDGAFPIGVDATAASRPVNLLGEKYVDLDPGDLGRPAPSGLAIPVGRTSRPVELDDVLNTLQPDVRARLRILINEAGIAVGGRGTDLNAVLDQLPSALDQSTELVGSFSANGRRLGDLIERSDRVLAALAGRREDLQSLVDAAADTLAVTASRRRELAATVRAAPQTLRSLRATMGQLADTSARLEPFAAAVRRTAPLLAQTLEDLPAFAGDAAPAMNALRTTAPSLEQLGRDARTPVRRLRPTAARLATFARDLAPVVGSFDRHATRNLLGLMDGWAKTIARSDGLGHLFGLRILFDRTLLTTLVDRYVAPSTRRGHAIAREGRRRAPPVPVPVLRLRGARSHGQAPGDRGRHHRQGAAGRRRDRRPRAVRRRGSRRQAPRWPGRRRHAVPLRRRPRRRRAPRLPGGSLMRSMRRSPLRRTGGERGRPVSHTPSRGFLVALGTTGVVVAVAMLYIGYNSPKSIPGRSYYTVSAQFDNADNLTSSYQVRIGGRLVGQVLNPRVVDGKGTVDLQLQTDVRPLLSDTTVKVRPRSPVGVRFVELHPGTTGTPLRDGDTIPASQTSVTVQIDEALDTLDAPRRRHAQVLIDQLGQGLLSRGEDINAAIAKGPEALTDLTAVARAVNAVPRGVERFVAGTDAAAAAADPVRGEIASGFAPEAKALRPFADEGAALRGALDVAPAALRSVAADLGNVTPALAALERLAAAGEPTLRAAVPTLRTTNALLTEARPGLDALPATLGRVRTAVPPTLGLLRRLNPVLPSLDRTLASALPIVGELAPRDCDLLRFFRDWSQTLSYSTSYSNVLRFSVEGSTETLQGLTQKLPRTYQSAYAAPCAPDTQKLPGAPK